MAAQLPAPAPGDPPVPAILLVDDNEVKRIALRAMLAPLGHPVVEVSSGRAALAAIAVQTFALILMDVRMPTLSGFETAKLCRRQSGGAHTPIIFITAVGGDETEAASAYDSGAVDFIFNPVLPDVLRAKVSAFVDLFLQSQELQRSLKSITTLNEALRDSDLRTQAVLDNVTDGIFIIDEEGAIESVNRSVSHLFGYRSGEPVGRRFTSMIAPERRAEFGGLAGAPARLGMEALRAGGRSRREDVERMVPPSRWSSSAPRSPTARGGSRWPRSATSPSDKRIPKPSSTWRCTTVSPAWPTGRCSAISCRGR